MIEEILGIGLTNAIISIEDLKTHSVLELIYLIIDRINRLIKANNELVSVGLPEAVSNQLVKWLEDGTLNEILMDKVTRFEKQLLNPECFRLDGMSDHDTIQEALRFANQHNIPEIHLYKDYNIKNLILSSPIVIDGHGFTVRDSGLDTNTSNDVFIQIDGCKVTLKHLRLNAEHSKIGILNLDGTLIIDDVFTWKAQEVGVEYRKVTTKGDGEINSLDTQLSKIGLYLNTTDVVANLVKGWNCLTHIKVNGGGNTLSNCHGWNMNNAEFGDWVKGSVYLDVNGNLIASNLYADTTEVALKLPTGDVSKYNLINITNLNYFLNRSFYPENDTRNAPKPIQNVSSYQGYLNIYGLQIDNGAWKQNGSQVDLLDSKPNYHKIDIQGISNNGYTDQYFMAPKGGNIWDDGYVEEQFGTYFTAFTNTYEAHKKERWINVVCSLAQSVPNGVKCYQMTLKGEFANLTSSSIVNAVVLNGDDAKILTGCINAGKIIVYNTSGSTITSGNLSITVHYNKIR